MRHQTEKSTTRADVEERLAAESFHFHQVFDRVHGAVNLSLGKAVQKLTPVSLSLLRRVIENSRRYYRDPQAKKALDDILNEEPADDSDGR